MKSNVNLGLPAAPDTKDAELYNQLALIYRALNSLSSALDTYTGQAIDEKDFESQIPFSSTLQVQRLTRFYVKAADSISPGHMLTLFKDTDDELKAKKAGGPTWAGDCSCFCSSSTVATSGDWIEVRLFGLDTFISGLTLGSKYYLSNVSDGLITDIEPTTVGDRVQLIGQALSTSALWFNPEQVSKEIIIP